MRDFLVDQFLWATRFNRGLFIPGVRKKAKFHEVLQDRWLLKLFHPNTFPLRHRKKSVFRACKISFIFGANLGFVAAVKRPNKSGQKAETMSNFTRLFIPTNQHKRHSISRSQITDESFEFRGYRKKLPSFLTRQHLIKSDSRIKRGARYRQPNLANYV